MTSMSRYQDFYFIKTLPKAHHRLGSSGFIYTEALLVRSALGLGGTPVTRWLSQGK